MALRVVSSVVLRAVALARIDKSTSSPQPSPPLVVEEREFAAGRFARGALKRRAELGGGEMHMQHAEACGGAVRPLRGDEARRYGKAACQWMKAT